MREKYLMMLVLLFAIHSISIGQAIGKYRIVHLSEEDFNNQIQLCSDSAYLELGISKHPTKRDDNSYEWLRSMIDELIEKKFPNDFLKTDSNSPNVINYRIAWERKNKNLTYNISFF